MLDDIPELFTTFFHKSNRTTQSSPYCRARNVVSSQILVKGIRPRAWVWVRVNARHRGSQVINLIGSVDENNKQWEGTLELFWFRRNSVSFWKSLFAESLL